MAVQHIYTYTNMWRKVLDVDKLRSMDKKGNVHGKEYWMFEYDQLFCFQMPNVSNVTTVFNSRRCSKCMFKTIHFLKITEEKQLFGESFE